MLKKEEEQNIILKTGALDATLGALLKKMKGKEQWLIPILMVFFAIGGTTYGMQEEAVAVSLVRALG